MASMANTQAENVVFSIVRPPRSQWMPPLLSNAGGGVARPPCQSPNSFEISTGQTNGIRVVTAVNPCAAKRVIDERHDAIEMTVGTQAPYPSRILGLRLLRHRIDTARLSGGVDPGHCRIGLRRERPAREVDRVVGGPTRLARFSSRDLRNSQRRQSKG